MSITFNGYIWIWQMPPVVVADISVHTHVLLWCIIFNSWSLIMNNQSCVGMWGCFSKMDHKCSIETESRQRDERSLVFICKKSGCRKVFWTYRCWISHIIEHLGAKSPNFYCDSCSKRFKTFHELMSHQKSYLEIQIGCNNCNVYDHLDVINNHDCETQMWRSEVEQWDIDFYNNIPTT